MSNTDKEARLKSALSHSVNRDHRFMPKRCDGCLDVAAWLAVPGYDGERQHPLLRIGEEAR